MNCLWFVKTLPQDATGLFPFGLSGLDVYVVCVVCVALYVHCILDAE